MTLDRILEVCVFRIYAFDLFLRRVWIALRCVFYFSVGMCILMACMFDKCIMGYEYFIHSIDMFLDISI